MATLTSHSPSLSPKPSAAFHASSNRAFASSSVRRTRSPRLSASMNSPSFPKPQANTSAPSASDSFSAKAQNHAAQRRTNPSAANASDPLAHSPNTNSRPHPSTFSSTTTDAKADAIAKLGDSPQQHRSTVDRGTQYTPPLYPPTYRNPSSRPHPSLTSPRQPARRERSVSRSSQSTNASTRRGLARASLDDTNAINPAGLAMAATRDTHGAAAGVAVAARSTLNSREEEGSGDSEESSSAPSSGSAASQYSPQQAQPQRTTALTQPSRLTAGDAEASGSNKRARPDAPAEKELPRDYWDCDVTDLGLLISDMLLDLVRINDKIPLKDGQLTRFHSRAPPAISVRDYLNRLIVHATLIPPILLAMVYYIDRLCALYPAFTISSLTVHRFLISAATVAAKGLSDSFWTNNTYARVGGVSLKELALLELEFLERMDWRIVPPNEVLIDYYRSLVERNGGYRFSEETHAQVPA